MTKWSFNTDSIIPPLFIFYIVSPCKSEGCLSGGALDWKYLCRLIRANMIGAAVFYGDKP